MQLIERVLPGQNVCCCEYRRNQFTEKAPDKSLTGYSNHSSGKGSSVPVGPPPSSLAAPNPAWAQQQQPQQQYTVPPQQHYMAPAQQTPQLHHNQPAATQMSQATTIPQMQQTSYSATSMSANQPTTSDGLGTAPSAAPDSASAGPPPPAGSWLDRMGPPLVTLEKFSF